LTRKKKDDCQLFRERNFFSRQFFFSQAMNPPPAPQKAKIDSSERMNQLAPRRLFSQVIAPFAPKKVQVTRAPLGNLAPRRLFSIAPFAPKKVQVTRAPLGNLAPRRLEFLTPLDLIERRLCEERRQARNRARMERMQNLRIFGSVLFD
jgi:hypothetical protein